MGMWRSIAKRGNNHDINPKQALIAGNPDCRSKSQQRKCGVRAIWGRHPAITCHPDKVDTRLGTLDFKDGVPSKATAEKLYDNLDFTYAYRAVMDNLRGVSIQSVRKGLQSVGVKDNEVLVFEQLMDAKSLFLTANADTIYVMGT